MGPAPAQMEEGPGQGSRDGGVSSNLPPHVNRASEHVSACGVERLAFDPEDPLPRKDSIACHVVVLFNELFLGILLQSIVFLTYVRFDLLTPTSFCIASRLQITNTLVGLITYIYGAFQLSETLFLK